MKIVKAKNLQDYLAKYYKKSLLTDGIFYAYVIKLEKHGYVCTPGMFNNQLDFIAWTPNKTEKKTFIEKVQKEWLMNIY
jgi:hypothetical protein